MSGPTAGPAVLEIVGVRRNYSALRPFRGVPKQVPRLSHLAGMKQLHGGFEAGELFLRGQPFRHGHSGFTRRGFQRIRRRLWLKADR